MPIRAHDKLLVQPGAPSSSASNPPPYFDDRRWVGLSIIATKDDSLCTTFHIRSCLSARNARVRFIGNSSGVSGNRGDHV